MQALKRMLTGWGLIPIIMAEQPNSGRTLFQKLVSLASSVRYAIILLTPDDVGSLRNDFAQRIEEHLPNWFTRLGLKWWNSIELENRLGLKHRARQNVIFEYGMFVGQLTPSRVCLLKMGNLEFPTDLSGMAHHEFRTSVMECESNIRRELETAGYLLRFGITPSFVVSLGPRVELGTGREIVPESELPSSVRAQVERIRQNERTIGPVTVYRDSRGYITIQYDYV